MGRELKRVALDWKWPLEEVWTGYLNPHYEKCPHCSGGYSKSYDIVAEHINKLMWSRAVQTDTNVAAITEYLAGRAPSFPFGHDSCDAWSAVKKIGELAGLPPEWGTCEHCGGSGQDPAMQEQYDTWKPAEPPVGPGYQIWETVSEGSPISPVFATAEELAAWMAGKKWGADDGSPYEAWLAFINGPGWMPSMTMDSTGVHSGPETVL